MRPVLLLIDLQGGSRLLQLTFRQEAQVQTRTKLSLELLSSGLLGSTIRYKCSFSMFSSPVLEAVSSLRLGGCGFHPLPFRPKTKLNEIVTSYLQPFLLLHSRLVSLDSAVLSARFPRRRRRWAACRRALADIGKDCIRRRC